jgi:hypothetical protein
MAYPVTLNGRTYTLADFEGNNYVDGLPDAFEDFVTHAGDVYNDTSTTSNSIGTGSKTFTVTAGKPYQAGTPLRIADAAAPATNFLDAVVTSYSGTTLVVEAIGYAGSGTLTSWTVNIGGAKTIDGTLGVSQGGTGATTAAAALTNLGTYSKTEADSRFLNVSGEASDVTMTGNVTIGDASGDTLTVNAAAAFNAGPEIVTGTGADASLIIRNDTGTTPRAFLDLRRGASSETFGSDNYMDWRLDNSSLGAFQLTYGKNSATPTIMHAALNGVTDGVDFSWNNGTTANSFGAYEFHQSADSVNDGLAVVSSDNSSMRLYVDSSGTRKITSGSTDFITFTNASGAQTHIQFHESVGINTDTPDAPLHIKSDSTTGMLILESDYDGSASTPDFYFYNNSATPADDDLIGNILFRSNTDDGNDANMAQIFIQATDVSAGSFNSKMMLKTSVNGSLDSRLILTGAGNVTIGTGTMERTNLASTSAALSVEGKTASSAGMSIIRNSNDTNPAYLTLGKSRGSSEGSNTILQDGDDIGRIVFSANDGTSFMSTADIISRVEETTPSTSNVGATLELRTGGGTNVSGTSRIKIKSDGRIRFNVIDTDIDDGAYIFRCLGNTADDALSVFSSDEGGSMRFLVDTAGVRAVYAGSEEVMRFKSGQSDSGRVTFTKGDGIRVAGGQSAFTHTDFEPYLLGTVSPTLYLGYNSVSRGYSIDPSVEFAVERASDAVINIVTDASSSSSIWFGDNIAGNAGQINYDHSSDSMLFKTAATTAFNVNSSGNISFPDGQGVLFSAAQTGNGESSLLHDYEEGSYTPVLTFGGSSVNAPSWAEGTYTKIGNRVFIDIRMSWTASLGSNLGGAKVSLPFTVYNSTTNTQWEHVASFYSLSNVTTTLVAAFSDVGGGLIFATAQGTSNEADHNDFPSSSNFRVTGSYRTSA